jgi:hypothetical protein
MRPALVFDAVRGIVTGVIQAASCTGPLLPCGPVPRLKGPSPRAHFALATVLGAVWMYN